MVCRHEFNPRMNGVLRSAGEGHQILDVLDQTPGGLNRVWITLYELDTVNKTLLR